MRRILGGLFAVVMGAALCTQAGILGPWEDAGDPIPTALTDTASVVLDGKLYVIGGADIFLFESDLVQVYDPSQPAGSRWSTAASLNHARFKHGAAAYDGKIYVFGGEDLDGAMDTLEVYDPGANTWTDLTASGKPRAHPGVAAAMGTLWVLGGEVPGATVTNEVQVYDITGEAWDVATALPFQADKYGAQMSAMTYSRNGTEYVGFACGVGWDSQVGTSARIDASSVTNEWVELPAAPSRSGHGGAVLPDSGGADTMWVFGGGLGGAQKDDVSFYGESEGGAWISDRPLPALLSGKPAVGRIGDYVYVTAGLDSNTVENATTYRAPILLNPFQFTDIQKLPGDEVELTFTATADVLVYSEGYEEISGDLYALVEGLETLGVYAADVPGSLPALAPVDLVVPVVEPETTWSGPTSGMEQFFAVGAGSPPRTGILVEWAGAEEAESGVFSSLAYQPASDDLLQGAGVVPSKDAGAFYSTEWGHDPAFLSDSPSAGDGGAWVLPRDYGWDQTAVGVRWDFPSPTDVQDVLVFSSWSAGRCFHTYDLEVLPTGESQFVSVAKLVRTGPWYQAFGGAAKSYYTRVYREDGNPLGTALDAIRVNLYSVSDLTGPDNVYQPPPQAFQSPIIWEVDAFGPPQ